jgi:tetratricopeptide (TPR) repeat protein
MERELAALIAFADGRRGDALAVLHSAADAEARLPPPLGLPEPIKPAPELLGELLLEAGRGSEADGWFERALARNPKRSLSILGRARAAQASGDRARAKEHYDQLLENLAGADQDLALLAEARAGSGRPAPGADRATPASPPQRPPWWIGLFASPGGLIILSLAVGAVVLTWIVARKATGGAPARSQKKGPR